MNTRSKTPGKARIFIVDDHPLIRDMLTRLIVQEGDLEVCGWAGNTGDAKSGIERLKPDLAIIDIGLRGKSGIDLTRFLIDQNSKALILVLSMHDEAVYAHRALKAGARGYVCKRETSETAILAIRRILSGEMYISESLAQALAAEVSSSKRRDPAEGVSLLSDKELEVFRLLAGGKETPEIARDLSVSVKTVQTYCGRIKEKLNLRNATELLQAATRWLDAENAG